MAWHSELEGLHREGIGRSWIPREVEVEARTSSLPRTDEVTELVGELDPHSRCSLPGRVLANTSMPPNSRLPSTMILSPGRRSPGGRCEANRLPLALKPCALLARLFTWSSVFRERTNWPHPQSLAWASETTSPDQHRLRRISDHRRWTALQDEFVALTASSTQPMWPTQSGIFPGCTFVE